MPDPLAREPIATAPLSVVLLAHDEGPSLDEALIGWLNAAKTLQRDYEVIVVDDGSTDDTQARADALAVHHAEIRVIHNPQRRGLGAALRTGLAAVRYPLVLTSTCDRQYDPGDLPRLLERIDKVDLVTGIRVWRPVPAWLRGLGLVYRLIARVVFGISLEQRVTWLGWSGYPRRWLARWIFGLRIQDGECVLRLYRRSILCRLVVQSDGPFAEVELLAKANFLGCLMDEVPVTYRLCAKGGIADSDLSPHTLTEAWRLFNAPDFGPAKLPT
jgi:glycosyltransferase involved in cell wall biosynthesis